MNGPVRLNRKLSLETPSRFSDGAGGWQETWIELGTLWAELRLRSGRETGGEGGSLSSTGYRITVRAAPHGAPSRPVAGQRFREGARVFAITSVGERAGDARYLVCFAEEEVAV